MLKTNCQIKMDGERVVGKIWEFMVDDSLLTRDGSAQLIGGESYVAALPDCLFQMLRRDSSRIH